MPTTKHAPGHVSSQGHHHNPVGSNLQHVMSSTTLAIKEESHRFCFTGHSGMQWSWILNMPPFVIIQVLLLGIGSTNDICCEFRQSPVSVTVHAPVHVVSSLDHHCNPAGSNRQCVTSSTALVVEEEPHHFCFCGHSRTLQSRILYIPPFLLIQVTHYSTCRSDNRMLVILPCPQHCISIEYDCFQLCELLLCADSESNPICPSMQAMFEKILHAKGVAKRHFLKNNQSELDTSLRNLSVKLERVEQLVSDLKISFNTLAPNEEKMPGRFTTNLMTAIII